MTEIAETTFERAERVFEEIQAKADELAKLVKEMYDEIASESIGKDPQELDGWIDWQLGQFIAKLINAGYALQLRNIVDELRDQIAQRHIEVLEEELGDNE